MPIPVACPNCREEFDVPDRLAGKQIRCRQCQTIFRVAGGEGVQKPAAVRNAVPQLVPADDDDYAPPPRKSKAWLYVLLGAGAACLLLCVGCSAVGALLYSARRAATMPAVVVNTVPSPPVESNPITPVDTNPNPPAHTRPRRPLDTSPKTPPPNPVPEPPDDEPTGPKLDADPLPELGKELADPHGSLPLQVDGNNPVRYSWRPGPVVAVVAAGAKKKEAVWQVWNLQSMKQIGDIPAMGGSGSSGMELRVSSDGAYVSAPIYPPGSIRSTGIQIYSVTDAKPLAKLTPPRSSDSRIGITEFAGPGQYLSLHDEGRTGVANVYDVKTGEEVVTFKTVGQIDRKANVLSPGGRYLAMFDSWDFKHPIQVYEIKTGKVVRTLKPRMPQVGWYNCIGLVFSPDGKELAALFSADGGDYLQAWDFETGKRTASHKFTTPLSKTAKSAGRWLIDSYPAPLEWLPDRSGWLAYGQLFIDHNRGIVFWTLAPEDPNVLWQRRFLDADHYVTVMVKSPKERQLEIVTLPKDEIAAARKK